MAARLLSPISDRLHALGFESQKLAPEALNGKNGAQTLKRYPFEWKKIKLCSESEKSRNNGENVTVELPGSEPAPTETGPGSNEIAAESRRPSPSSARPSPRCIQN